MIGKNAYIAAIGQILGYCRNSEQQECRQVKVCAYAKRHFQDNAS